MDIIAAGLILLVFSLVVVALWRSTRPRVIARPKNNIDELMLKVEECKVVNVIEDKKPVSKVAKTPKKVKAAVPEQSKVVAKKQRKPRTPKVK